MGLLRIRFFYQVYIMVLLRPDNTKHRQRLFYTFSKANHISTNFFGFKPKVSAFLVSVINFFFLFPIGSTWNFLTSFSHIIFKRHFLTNESEIISMGCMVRSKYVAMAIGLSMFL